MKIHGINCNSTSETWSQLLSDTFITPVAKDQKHHYLYLNRDGKLAHFSSNQEAKKGKYEYKLTVDDVIYISQKHFGNYQHCLKEEVSILRRVYQAMGNGARKSWWTRLFHWFRGLGFQHTEALIKTELARQELQLIAFANQKSTAISQKLHDKLKEFESLAFELLNKPFIEAYYCSKQKEEKLTHSVDQTAFHSYTESKNHKTRLTELLTEVEQNTIIGQKLAHVAKQLTIAQNLLNLKPSARFTQAVRDKLEKIVTNLHSLIENMFVIKPIHDLTDDEQNINSLLEELCSINLKLANNFESEQNIRKEQLYTAIMTPEYHSNSPLHYTYTPIPLHLQSPEAEIAEEEAALDNKAEREIDGETDSEVDNEGEGGISKGDGTEIAQSD